MKICYCFLTLLFIVFVLNSCSNEVDVLADYEENASIYGLLDPSADTQFIKINKVFTNPNVSANSVAQIPDSLYFDDDLSPTLTEIETGRIITLIKTDVQPKISGTFATTPNYLYTTTQRIFHRYDYRLDLHLPQTKKYVTATSNVPDSARLTSPLSVIVNPSVIEIPEDRNLVVNFNSAKDSKIFDCYFYFNYLEVNKQDTNIKVNKTIQWRMFSKIRVDDPYTSNQVQQKPLGTSFYDQLLAKIPVDPAVERRFLPCKMVLTSGNLELDNYIQATEPSIGIVQKQTEYTNIINGIGLFASRSLSKYSNIALGLKTKTTISTGDNYKKLGFVL